MLLRIQGNLQIRTQTLATISRKPRGACANSIAIINCTTWRTSGLSSEAVRFDTSIEHWPEFARILLPLCSDILALLLNDPNVSKVFVLNRYFLRGPAPACVCAQLTAKGFDTLFLQSKKLVFIYGHTSLSKFGLDYRVFEEAQP